MPRREQLTASIRLVASSRGPLLAPDHFRIWRAGPNPGDYGELFFTPRAAAAVMTEYTVRGNAIVMDIEHGLNPRMNPGLDPSAPPPTAGYLELELVDELEGPELWALPRWSDCGRPAPVPGEVCCGKHQVESGQRCYVSPDWDIDADTREPIRLNRVSLVAEPATWAINLLASRAVGSASQGATMDEMEKMRAGYAAAKTMMGSADSKAAKAASTLCAAYEQAASTLGIKLEDAGEGGGEPKTEGAAAAAGEGETTTNQVDPKQASGADPSKVDDAARGPGPGPAVAAVATRVASRAAAAVVAGGDRPITGAELERVLAERDERGRLTAGISDRVPKGHENLVASMSLGQLREYSRGLPAKVAPASGAGDGGGAVTAGKGTAGAKPGAGEPMSPKEQYLVERWAKALGVKDANMTASRKAWDDDRHGGAIEIDIFKLSEGFRNKARIGRAA